MTREQVVEYVRGHSGCTTADVAEALGIDTRSANAHLTRAAEDCSIVQSTIRRPFTWHAVQAAPAAPRSAQDAHGRLAEIAATRRDLDREEQALLAYLAAWSRTPTRSQTCR